MKFIYATDLHGIQSSYEGLLSRARKEKIKAVLIGGDISLLADAATQRVFLAHYLMPTLELAARAGLDIFIMMGNDDFSVNMDLLVKAERGGALRIMENKVYKFGDKHIAGYPFIGPTPFLIKDWEKTESQIMKDLNKLAKQSPPDQTVYVFHVPPFGTKLDMLWSGGHAGSEAIKKWVLKTQPLLTLHGHIHESPEMSGAWKQKIGRTICVNPGACMGVIIDTKNLSGMRRVKI